MADLVVGRACYKRSRLDSSEPHLGSFGGLVFKVRAGGAHVKASVAQGKADIFGVRGDVLGGDAYAQLLGSGEGLVNAGVPSHALDARTENVAPGAFAFETLESKRFGIVDPAEESNGKDGGSGLIGRIHRIIDVNFAVPGPALMAADADVDNRSFPEDRRGKEDGQ